MSYNDHASITVDVNLDNVKTGLGQVTQQVQGLKQKTDLWGVSLGTGISLAMSFARSIASTFRSSATAKKILLSLERASTVIEIARIQGRVVEASAEGHFALAGLLQGLVFGRIAQLNAITQLQMRAEQQTAWMERLAIFRNSYGTI